MTIVLGINGLTDWHVRHDPAAAVIIDGLVAAAVEEERLVRVKRADGLPPARSVREVLDVAGIGTADVDVVTYPWVPGVVAAAESEVGRMIRDWFGPGLRPDVDVRFVEHHLAHVWSGMAFIPGGAEGRRVGALVLDGSGETTAGVCCVYDGELHRRWHLAQSSSLGGYYEALSVFLGFELGDEGKTMGLASYGRDVGVPLPPLPDDRFDGALPAQRDHAELSADSFTNLRSRLIGAFRDLLGGGDLSFQRRADIAYAAERFVERRVLAYVAELLDEVDVLVLSGGLALNCSINARVAALCRSRGVELVIPPPASDTGVALGSAIARDERPSVVAIAEPYLGRAYAPDDIVRELRDLGATVEPLSAGQLAGELLERSAVCGWFEGRAEIGPRALGRRSILSRADSIAVRDRVNALKGREGWRPLAPSLTPDEFDRAFAGSTASPHMLIAAQATPEARHRLQGAVHVDGSSRPQVVRSAGAYRDLLVEVGRASGAEAVICTSFNRAGEPMVYSPRDALRSARTMGLDLLAGEGWCVRVGSAI